MKPPQRTRVVLTREGDHMSWGYWGIVGGLMAMVATMFVCVGLVYPKGKRSGAPIGAVDRPSEGVPQELTAYRRAA